MFLLRKFIISLLLFSVTGIVYAQETNEDSLESKTTILAVLFSADYGKGIESLVNNQQKWEAGITVSLFTKVRLVGEYGYGSLQPANVINNGTYFSEGSYFRIGGEYVFTIKPKIYLSTGILFAQSSYADRGSVSIGSELWKDIEADFNRDGLSANWFEWVLNTESQTFRNAQNILNNLYWGTRIRIRYLNTEIAQPDFDIYAIPGFGKTYSTVVPAVNLFIKYRLDF